MREAIDVSSGFGVGALLLLLLGCASSGGVKSSATRRPTAVDSPVATVETSATSIHGRELSDDYGWLRDRDSERVVSYLEAENAYTEAEMEHTKELQETLFGELLARIKEDDAEPPYRRGAFLYYTRTEQGKPYKIYCRKASAPGTGDEGEEEIILDVNALADGHEFYEIGPISISPDHRYLAYGFDVDGSEDYTVVVKDLVSGDFLGDRIDGVSYSLEWANDNRTFFYSIRDEATRPFKVLRHRIGSAAGEDEVVFHEEDESFWLGLDKTRSERYLLLGMGSSTTTEYWILDADDPEGEFRVFAPRQHEVEYQLSHAGDSFYVLTNEGAKNFRLFRAPVEGFGRDQWVEVIEHRDDTKLEVVDNFADFMVVRERDRGQRRLRVMSYGAEADHYVELPEKVYTLGSGQNAEFESASYRFTYTSLVTPRTVYEYAPEARELDVLKRQEVLGDYDPRRYVTERIYATAADGEQVPMSLVYRRGLEKNGRNPCLLYAYGSYGATIDPRFSSVNLSLIDRGFIYAIAHIRGGGFLGEPWHDGGKMLTKRNTFTDYVAAAEHLVQRGYTSPDRLAARGGSAGGLLMGAVVNLRPDLFGAVLAHVPFVDVINTMLDDSIPLTVIEYEEWGNPNELEYFDYMLSYSPYDNVEAKDYPPMLVTAGLNDPRVQYWEPAKWVAKLRAEKTDDNRLLLKTNMGAGHGGASGRYGALRETAFE